MWAPGACLQGLSGCPAGSIVAAMAHPAPAVPPVPSRYTVQQYFQLVDDGVLSADDRVELLEGVVVAMAPHGV